jgi:predicted Zn-dependent protease
LPGGQIFVMRGLLEFVQSESELAAVLGHEMSHVDLRHCIEHYQYETVFNKAGAPEVGGMVELAHRLIAQGFSAEQESEADAQGERLSIEAGYDPDAAAALFTRMQRALHEPRRVQSTTPLGEAAQASIEALEAYFRTHPPTEQRVRKLNEMVAQHHRELAGRAFYVGKQNVRERVPRSIREYPGEYRQF